MDYQVWIFILIIVTLTVTVLIVGNLVRQKCAATTEKFTTRLPSNSEPLNAVPARYGPRRNIPARKCAVYLTPNVELCNDVIYQWYQKPLLNLQRRRAELAGKARSPAEQTEFVTLDKVIQDRLTGNLPDDICKVEFDGWSEPTTDADGNRIPYKTRKAMEEGRGRIFDWSHCYKAVSDPSQANVEASRFADGRHVVASSTSFDPFKDGKSYARVSFRTLNIDDAVTAKTKPVPTSTSLSVDPPNLNPFICSQPPPKIGTIPRSYVVLDVDQSKVIRKFRFQTFDPATQTFTDYANPMELYPKFFTEVMRNGSLYLVPKGVTGVVYRFMKDTCQRVSGVTSSNRQLTLSLQSDFGVPERLLYQSTYGSPAYGKVAELQARIADYGAQIGVLNREIQTLQGQLNSANPSYQRGLVEYEYNVKPNVSYGPELNTEEGMTRCFTELMSMGTKKVVQKNAKYWDFIYRGDKVRFGVIYEGYLRLDPARYPSGTYRFNINSDDGADLKINNQVIASHYGYHWVDNQGKRGTIQLTAGQYYKFTARFVQWYGAAGMNVQWVRPGSNVEEDLPADVFFYDATEFTRAEGTTRMQEQEKVKQRDQLVRDQSLAQSAYNTIFNAIRTLIPAEMQAIVGRTFSRLDFEDLSKDSRLYMFIGEFNGVIGWQNMGDNEDKRVSIQETIRYLCDSPLKVPSPITNLRDPVVYTVSFWMKIDSRVPWWNSIFFNGAHDDWNMSWGGDRTPGIWLWPNESRIHFRHRTNKDWNDGLDTGAQSPMFRWFHFAAVVNGSTNTITTNEGESVPANSIALYINGQRREFRQMNDRALNWGQASGAKTTKLNLYGMDHGWTYCQYMNGVQLAKVYWFNRALGGNYISSSLVANQSPASPNLPVLLNDPNVRKGIANLLIDGSSVAVEKVFLGDLVPGNQGMGVTVLRYVHRGGTNPPPRVIRPGEDFPLHQVGASLGNNGYEYQENGVRASWGHLSPEYLAKLDFNEVIFYGRSSGHNRTVFFSTRDARVIANMKRRLSPNEDLFPSGFQYQLLPGHTAQYIPQDAPNKLHGSPYGAQHGDYVLTSFPLWKWGTGHWSCGAWARWEMDDFPADARNHTVHMIVVRKV